MGPHCRGPVVQSPEGALGTTLPTTPEDRGGQCREPWPPPRVSVAHRAALHPRDHRSATRLRRCASGGCGAAQPAAVHGEESLADLHGGAPFTAIPLLALPARPAALFVLPRSPRFGGRELSDSKRRRGHSDNRGGWHHSVPDRHRHIRVNDRRDDVYPDYHRLDRPWCCAGFGFSYLAIPAPIACPTSQCEGAREQRAPGGSGSARIDSCRQGVWPGGTGRTALRTARRRRHARAVAGGNPGRVILDRYHSDKRAGDWCGALCRDPQRHERNYKRGVPSADHGVPVAAVRPAVHHDPAGRVAPVGSCQCGASLHSARPGAGCTRTAECEIPVAGHGLHRVSECHLRIR